MTLKLKFTLLVATCVMLLLASYYFVSVRLANDAIVGFNEQSAVIFNQSLLDDDDVEAFIKRQDVNYSVFQIADALSQRYPEQLFLITRQSKIIFNNLEVPEASVEVKKVLAGFQFLIKQPDIATIVVQIGGPQLEFDRAGSSYHLFWFPKVTLSRQEQQDVLREQLNDSFLINLLVLSCLAILFSWIGASYFLKPLTTLKQSFESIKRGRLDTRLAVKRQDEVGEIIGGFNELAAWLQGLHQQYKQMNSDLSHELRTPINAIQSRLEAMEDGLLDMSQQQASILLTELSQVRQLIDDLSLLSLTESSSLVLNIKDTDISRLINDVLARYQMLAADMQIELVGDIPVGVNWATDEGRLRQVLINLIDNAFHYGADGGKISVIVKSSIQQLQIDVIDKGKGLSAQQQNDVFERFYRVQQGRNSGGLGLGLPICQHLVTLMGGEIKLNSSPNNGSTFTLVFFKAS